MEGQVDGIVEGWRSSPQFDTHILWGNDVEEVHRTTGNCHSITNACMLPDVISRPIACRMP